MKNKLKIVSIILALGFSVSLYSMNGLKSVKKRRQECFQAYNFVAIKNSIIINDAIQQTSEDLEAVLSLLKQNTGISNQARRVLKDTVDGQQARLTVIVLKVVPFEITLEQLYIIFLRKMNLELAITEQEQILIDMYSRNIALFEEVRQIKKKVALDIFFLRKSLDRQPVVPTNSDEEVQWIDVEDDYSSEELEDL